MLLSITAPLNGGGIGGGLINGGAIQANTEGEKTDAIVEANKRMALAVDSVIIGFKDIIQKKLVIINSIIGSREYDEEYLRKYLYSAFSDSDFLLTTLIFTSYLLKNDEVNRLAPQDNSVSNAIDKNGITNKPDFLPSSYESEKVNSHASFAEKDKINNEMKGYGIIPAPIKLGGKKTPPPFPGAENYTSMMGDPQKGGGGKKKKGGVKWEVNKKRDIFSDIANVITILGGFFAGGDSGDNDPVCCQPCNSGSDGEQTRSGTSESESLSTTLGDIRFDVNRLAERFTNNDNAQPTDARDPYKWLDQSSFSSTLGEIRGNVQLLTNRFVHRTNERPTSGQVVKNVLECNCDNTVSDESSANIGHPKNHFISRTSSQPDSDKTSQTESEFSASSLMCGNIQTDVSLFSNNPEQPDSDKSSQTESEFSASSLMRGSIQTDVSRFRNESVSNDPEQSVSDETSKIDSELKATNSLLEGIHTNVGSLEKHFVSGASSQPASKQASQIEPVLKADNSSPDGILTNVGFFEKHVVNGSPAHSGNIQASQNAQQPDWSLMLLANIAIDVKRMADQYVGSNLKHSSNGPVFQNIQDTVWLNTTLNGIQDNTTRAVSLLPVQPNNYFNQTNNFTISGAQEPRAVAEAVRESVPMMGEYSQMIQVLQARA